MDQSSVLEQLGISMSLLVARGLQPFAEAAHLVVAEVDAEGREHRLVPEAASAWQRLKRAAHQDGVSLLIISGYRSVDRQAEIIRSKLATGQRMEEILTVCAPPGFSEHHTGRAVDLATGGVPALEVDFDGTAAFCWLVEHAHEFGYTLSYPVGNPQGYQYEPWHWCYGAVQQVAHGPS